MPDASTPLPDLVTQWRDQITAQGARFTVGATGTPYAGKLVAYYAQPNGAPPVIAPAPDYVEYAYERWIDGTDLNWNPSHVLAVGNVFDFSDLLHPLDAIESGFSAGTAAGSYVGAQVATGASAVAKKAGQVLSDAAKKAASAVGSSPMLVAVLVVGGLIVLARMEGTHPQQRGS